ncbi:tyrosine-type recombinase/integrase [Natrialbaceae archaeon A-CW2]|uniref:tyrosine-type recombinase/integrase n=1 Tax=Natronosalvus amylolyticus TaxID=2961994 RepID=UPI0020C99195|nr:tyrosine-type recombinase/integrase [Natronosalvus amylolyticus]
MDLSEFTLVPGPTEDRLGERQFVDYRTERADMVKWLLTFGIEPQKANGYAESTVKNRIYRMDQFCRFVWDQEGQYTTAVTHDHADAWMQELAYAECSDTHRDLCQKAVRMLFKWRAHERGGEAWEPEISFSSNDGTTTPRDYLTLKERKLIREAALEYGSIPSYNNVSPTERREIKAYLAQRFEKPMEDVTARDWERANSWKIPSLVSVSLDAGLRPIEVERAVISWVDLANGILRIPIEDSSKNEDNWRVSLSKRSVGMLERWLDQRVTYDLYDGRDELWLTREANPYGSASLRRILHQLCEIAGIEYENRQMSWYTIRHSTGTYMTREEDLAAAQTQLRHKSPETTMKYDQTPVEDRQDALDRIG